MRLLPSAQDHHLRHQQWGHMRPLPHTHDNILRHQQWGLHLLLAMETATLPENKHTSPLQVKPWMLDGKRECRELHLHAARLGDLGQRLEQDVDALLLLQPPDEAEDRHAGVHLPEGGTPCL